MNSVLAGAGIYVSRSQLSYSSSSLPNNSIITSNTGYYSYHGSGTRMSFYCCSNSTTSGSTGIFLGINGNSYSGRIRVQRYSYSNSYAGCMYISLQKAYAFYYQNFLSSSEEGIYTCRIPDSAGRNIDVSVGIYRQYYTSKFLLLCWSLSSSDVTFSSLILLPSLLINESASQDSQLLYIINETIYFCVQPHPVLSVSTVPTQLLSSAPPQTHLPLMSLG